MAYDFQKSPPPLPSLVDNDDGGYLDVDACLAEDERISVKFLVNAVRLGFLDSSKDSSDLEQNASVELPLWLVRELRRTQMVRFRPPQYLMTMSMTDMKASAQRLDLRASSPYYYEVSQLIAEMTPTKQNEIVDTLRTILSERYFLILDTAQSSREDDVSEYVQKLTVLETLLYNGATERAREMAKWKRRQTHRIESFAKKARLW